MLEIIKTHQQKIALALGFAAVAMIGFYGGKNINSTSPSQPSVSAVSATTNYTETTPAAQPAAATAQTTYEALDCTGKIKGSSTHKYHLPGGAFYKKTTKPIACFDTEAEAKSAGFVKSSR